MPRHPATTLAALSPLLLVLSAPAAWAEDDATFAAADVSGLVVTAPRDDTYRARRTSSATRTDTPLVDVPQSVTVITAALIRDQAMQGMADVIRYVPGVTMGQGEGHRDAPTLRGNASTADFYVDGVRDDVQYFRDLYNVERVEVLKGSNAMIFGRGGGGGVINRVLKRPDGVQRELGLAAGSEGHRRATADFDFQPSPSVGVRVVGVYESSDSFRDFVEVDRWGVNPTASWRMGPRVAATLSYEHFEDHRTTDRGIPAFNGRPAPAPRGAFFGDPDRSAADTRVDVANLAVEYEASDDLVIRNRTVLGDYRKFYANIFAGGPAITGLDGAPATYPLQAYENDSPRRNAFNQTDVVVKARHGEVEHTVLTGVELGRQTTTNLRLTGHFNSAAGPTTLSGNPFGDPTRRGLPVFFTNTGSDANNRVRANVAAVYLQDQVELSPWLQVIAGLRFDRFEVDFEDRRSVVTGRRTFSRRDELWSPRLGLILKPSPKGSVYVSYSRSYLPSSGDQFSSLNATTETLKPERFENLEVGAKWDLTQDLLLTAALYRLDRDNTTAPDPGRPGQIVQTGAQRTEGFEAGVSGRLTPAWEIAGGYAWQDAAITETTSAAPAGRRVGLVPKHTVSLWNKHQISPRVAAGLGLVRQGKVFTTFSNTVTLPAFTRVDAALFLRLGRGLDAQLNVENLLDRRYFPTSHGDNNILPGAPRTFRLALTSSF